MSYIIKRKFRGLLGDDVDNSLIAPFVQQVQTNTIELVLSVDSLTVNNLDVKRTLKIPARTDGYRQ